MEDGLWSCANCRRMPETMLKLEQQMQALIDSNKDLNHKCSCILGEYAATQVKMAAMNAENDELIREIRQMRTEIEQREEQNENLKRLLEQQKEENSNLRKQLTASCPPTRDATVPASHSQTTPETQTKQDLLIGDSIIRDIDSTSGKLRVITIRGAKMADILHHLLQTDDDSYETVSIVVGTNDYANGVSAGQFQLDYDELLREARRVASKNVQACSILPRVDDSVHTLLPSLNTIIRTLCQQRGVVFINNDNNFVYSDGHPDLATLCSDGVHLSTEGTSRLIRNINAACVCRVSQRAYHSQKRNAIKQTPRPNSYRNVSEYYDTYQNHSLHQQPYKDGCYYCGEPGHTTKVCRHGDYIVCDKCGGYGHKRKHHDLSNWQ